MKKYILPVIFFFQAIILSLCLVGFTLLKGPLLEKANEPLGFCGTSDSFSPTLLVSLTEEEKEIRSRGEILFESNCSACHGVSRKKTGPALKNICDKYPGEDGKKWLFNWIRNSPKMIFVDKDPQAIKIWENNNKIAMNIFPNLSDQELKDILEYIQPGCFND